MAEIRIKSLNDIAGAAREFASVLQKHQIIAFNGEMGSGKTTFIKALCRHLGVETEVTSPTFAIVNEYEATTFDLVYHFDFYRLEKQSEVMDIGFEDYINSGYPLLIEWPDIAKNILPQETLNVYIKETELGERMLKY
jgi:tRNA threonylcarbamoyladenosine biosynthesis protein TsaE